MTILLVEDDMDLLDLFSFMFRREGYDTIAAHDGESGLQLWKAKNPRLVLLDVNLPRLSGLEVCKRIRADSGTPIIMVSAAAAESDVLAGLDIGADDYIAKPFSPRQLMARVRAVLRRGEDADEAPSAGGMRVSTGGLVLDPQWRTVDVDGRSVRLTAIECKLLQQLILHEGQVLTHQRLTDRVWGYDAVEDASMLKGHIRNLRRKIEADPAQPVYIQTVTGVGYTFKSRRAAPCRATPPPRDTRVTSGIRAAYAQ